MKADDPRHGEERGYFAHRKAGQRPCDACTIAHCAAAKRRAMRAMNGVPAQAPALGTQRRIQALAALGWRMADIANAAGYTRGHEAVTRLLRVPTVQRKTADRIATAYDQLSGKPGPSNVVRTNAQKRGWAPPLAWDDIDNDPAPKGMAARRQGKAGRPDITTARVEDFDFLVRNGETEEQAAERLGVRLSSFKDQRRRLERGQVA